MPHKDREAGLAYFRALNQRPERKLYQRLYNQKPEVKAAKRLYNKRPDRQLYNRVWSQMPETKENASVLPDARAKGGIPTQTNSQ